MEITFPFWWEESLRHSATSDINARPIFRLEKETKRNGSERKRDKMREGKKEEERGKGRVRKKKKIIIVRMKERGKKKE